MMAVERTDEHNETLPSKGLRANKAKRRLMQLEE